MHACDFACVCLGHVCECAIKSSDVRVGMSEWLMGLHVSGFSDGRSGASTLVCKQARFVRCSFDLKVTFQRMLLE